MKKKWRIVILAVVLFVLVVPVSIGTYKDGGTVEYTALTYKIVNWNKMYGDGQIYSKVRFYPFPMNFMSIDSLFKKEGIDLSAGTNSYIHEAQEQQTTDEGIFGYCGNTQTTVYIGEDKYTFMGGNSVTLTDLLRKLDYTDNVCKCLPEYTVDTEFGLGYGVNITESYVKYKGQQAELTKEQVHTINEIMNWVKTQKPDSKGD